MNVAYINPFINACIDVFHTFAGIASTPGKPVALKQPAGPGTIKGIIGLNGHDVDGYFIISFSRPFLEKIVTGLFEMTSSASTAELDDLAGELTNMITGSAKAQLSKQGYFFDVAVPRISHTLPDIPDHMKNCPVIMVPFTTPSGEYAIEASMKAVTQRD
jgi:chemotaxis protein CheX